MDEWERLERRWKIISRIVVGLICTAILFLLLMFVARHSGGKAQDQFTLICERAIREAREREAK
ncbi:MAG: hypothetical protein J6T51_00160 [Kiritimatiellae bacterium]|nr:hypothetical protein [Kiritimatiellia bacterium]